MMTKKTKRIAKLIRQGCNINEIPKKFQDEFLEARKVDGRNFKSFSGEWKCFPNDNFWAAFRADNP